MSRPVILRTGVGIWPGCRSIRRSFAAPSRTTSGSEPRCASDDGVRAAAAQAGADGFIEALPHGYETIVGDGGRPVSTGERRRIALARAFLRDAPFVILDEPTADLDPDGARVIADAVARLRTGRTVLLIAHRTELVQTADRVVKLEAGKVAP